MAIPLHDAQDSSPYEYFDDDQSLPSFTTAIRGYQKEEVHAYLRDLRHDHTDDARARQRLERETQELRQRVAKLEQGIAGQTPHTIDALGERMLLILHHAEAAAADAIAAAEAQAKQLHQEAAQRAESHVRQASLRASQAAQTLNAARAEAQRHTEETEAAVNDRRDAELREAERLATDMVSSARGRADTLLSDAQTEAARLLDDAQRRSDTLLGDSRRQSETLLADARRQSETMVAEAQEHAAELAARAARDEAAMRDQIGERKALADAHLDALADQRDDLLAEMSQIHASLARTLRASGFSAEDEDEADTDTTQEQPVIAGQ